MALKAFAPNFTYPTEQLLVQGALVDLSITTVQNLTQLTSPPNVSVQDPKLRFVVTRIAVRPLQALAATATTLTFGWAATATGATSTVAPATASMASQAAQTALVMVVGLSANNLVQPQPLGQSLQFLNATVATPQASGFYAQIDVFGFYVMA